MKMSRIPAVAAASAVAVAVIAIAVVVVVAAAPAPAAVGGGAAQPDQRVLRLGYFPVVGHAIPIVGVEQGIFTRYLPDVRIESRVFDSGPQVVEAMFAGSIDVAYVGPGPAINAFLNSDESDIIRILSGAASGGTSFVMHPDSASPEFDFAHKRIAAPQIGNTQDVSLRHYMEQRGLQASGRGGSVVVYNIPNPDIVTLFVKGEIDGAWVSEPWATILAEEHGGVRLFYEEEMWPGGKFATVLLIAGESYVQENRDVVDGWLWAHEEAAKVINADRDAAGVMFNDFLLDHFGQQLDPGVVREAIYNTEVTVDPLSDTVYEFAERADRLGYMGRGSYDLSGLFFSFDRVDYEGPGHGDDIDGGDSSDRGTG
ncbi:MAG: ABC transporter substrate-binding protein [Nitrosopumilaceae archaeon]|nr:ABC transporter substrate-binding protein [Nitrosopumilaceae archaeon]